MVDTTKSNKRDSKNSDQVKPKLLAGRLLFSDGVCETPRVRWVQIPGAGGGPHPWHTRFYFHQDGRGHILGRKLYFHHQSYEATLALYRQNERLKFIDVGGQLGRFTFTLDFVQLSQEELDLLVYALALEPGMRHHIGYGKPYGLGSVAISVQHIEWRYGPHNDGQSRYLTFDHQVARNSDLQPRVDAGKTIWLERLRGAGAMQVYNDFARILAWPGVDHYQYPDFGWFRNTAGSSAVTLAEYQAGVRTKSVATQSHTSSSGRLSGRVKWFNAEKNFGFIAIDGRNRDLFVHINEIAGRQPLREGQRVELEEGPSRRPGQTEAKNVTIVKG